MRPACVLSFFLYSAPLIGLSTACPDLNETLEKRFYGVGNPGEGEPRSFNAWPVKEPGDPSYPKDHPAGTPFQPVRICYYDQFSSDKIGPYMDKAIQKWQETIDSTALAIVGDQGDLRGLCESARQDALVIIDLVNPGTTAASLGYDESAKKVPGTWPWTRTHWMKLTSADLGSNNPSALAQAYFVLTIAHELGHVIGLKHEHSRPDRDDHIWFYCENLMDYQKVQAQFQARRDAGEFLDKTMEDVCSDWDLAKEFKFSVLQYMPQQSPWNTAIGMTQWSHNTYDFDSIMNYPSIPPRSSLGTDKAILLKPKPGKLKSSRDGDFIWQGGNRDYAQAKVSHGDKMRVAQIYPGGDAAVAAQAADPSWTPTSYGLAGNAGPAKRTAVPVA